MRRLAAVLLAAGLVAAGCGEDDEGNAPAAPTADQPTTTATTTTATAPADASPGKSRFISRVDAFCRSANQEGRALNRRLGQAVQGLQEPDRVLAAIAPLYAEGDRLQREQLRRFRRFEPPAGDEQAFAQMVEVVEQQVAAFARLTDATRRRDLQGFQRQRQALDTITRRRLQVFSAYGFKECGRGAEGG